MIEKQLRAVRCAAQKLRQATAEKKNNVLLNLALLLEEQKTALLTANQKDLKVLKRVVATANAFRDRLLLDEGRIHQMQESLRQVAALADPCGEVAEERVLDNGLVLRRVRSALGVIFMIFESRPNVAVEAFSLAFKAGNAIILRGGKEARHTTRVLYRLIQKALLKEGFDPHCIWGIENPDRKIPQKLLKMNAHIDVVVPRGGEGLIQFVVKNSTIPIIKNDRGMCHVYVHEDADLTMALNIVENAKTQRPGVCNAMETLLVHRSVARDFLPSLYERLSTKGVQWNVCLESQKILSGKNSSGLVKKAKPQAWDTEYLDLVMNCRIVKNLEEALTHIEEHGSRHSESIVTRDPKTAQSFQREVDAAAVYCNASTRFTDGFEFGLGGELGISTQKLHVRGPVGLKELTSLRWIIDGQGQVRS